MGFPIPSNAILFRFVSSHHFPHTHYSPNHPPIAPIIRSLHHPSVIPPNSPDPSVPSSLLPFDSSAEGFKVYADHIPSQTIPYHPFPNKHSTAFYPCHQQSPHPSSPRRPSSLSPRVATIQYLDWKVRTRIALLNTLIID